MGQRRSHKRDVHGWLVFDKPVGMTSTEAVGVLRRLFNARKAGHAGTLDPLASGLLPIAFGEATKTVGQVMEGRKVYSFTVRWGVETDTDDAEGTVVATSDHRPSADEIRAVLPTFTGEIEQVPPRFSAVKVEGERAYDLAREGEAFELAARTILVHRLDLVATPDADTAIFHAECGKGTYVRAMARDIARALGTRGHVAALRRLVVGPFGEADMIPLEKLRALSHSPAGDREGFALLDAELLPVETALDDIPALAVSRADAVRLKRGQAVILRGRDAPTFTGLAYAMSADTLVALGEVERGEFIPKRVFNLPERSGSTVLREDY